MAGTLLYNNVYTMIDVLLALINVRDGNLSCNGVTGEEINFMIYYDICVNRNCILNLLVFNAFYLFLYMYHI